MAAAKEVEQFCAVTFRLTLAKSVRRRRSDVIQATVRLSRARDCKHVVCRAEYVIILCGYNVACDGEHVAAAKVVEYFPGDVDRSDERLFVLRNTSLLATRSVMPMENSGE